MKNIILSMLFLTLLSSCVDETKKETLNNRIQGSWISINAEEILNNRFPGNYGVPFGLNFKKDSIDFFRQFTSYELDSVTNKMQFNAFAGLIPFQLKSDSLFIINPLKNNLELRYTIDASLKDTLLLKKNDSLIHTLERLPKREKDTIAFDQVVLSRSGCFGTCPIMNISIHKNGDVLFYGERSTDVIGLYKAKLSPQFTNYLFQKFEDVNISKVANSYNVSHTDDETISTTFIQHDKIVKTIQDYGKAGTKELLWAYLSIENLHKQLALSSIPIEETKPTFNHYNFKTTQGWLLLKKSESFLLWNLLQNSQITTTKFEKKFALDFRLYRFSNEDTTIKVETDGRYFKYYTKNDETITYDIGYNFIDRNFTDSDFKPVEIID